MAPGAIGQFVRQFSSRSGRRVVIRTHPGGGGGGPGQGSNILLGIALAVGGVIMVAFGAVVLVIGAVGIAGVLLYVRVAPVRHPMLVTLKRIMTQARMQRQAAQAAKNKVEHSVDAAGAVLRRTITSKLSAHRNISKALGSNITIGPLHAGDLSESMQQGWVSITASADVEGSRSTGKVELEADCELVDDPRAFEDTGFFAKLSEWFNDKTEQNEEETYIRPNTTLKALTFKNHDGWVDVLGEGRGGQAARHRRSSDSHAATSSQSPFTSEGRIIDAEYKPHKD